jgi:Vacuolar sorting protein 9 (VPS9) domain
MQGFASSRSSQTDRRCVNIYQCNLDELLTYLSDGLSRLPKLRLKPEREFIEQDQKTPRASAFSKHAAQEAINEASTPPADPALTGSEETTTLEHTTTDSEVSVSSSQATNPATIPALDADVSDPTHPTKTPSDQLDSQSPLTIVPSRSSPPPLPPRPHSPTHDSGSSTPSAISGDLLFPLLIFSVVKANPAHLVSHLLYTQRFRSRSIGGQESYCLINLMAVVEFLEHVDMVALGLGDNERVMRFVTSVSLFAGRNVTKNLPTVLRT